MTKFIENTNTPNNSQIGCNLQCGLYVHIPFCDAKCSYCDFVSNKYSEAVQIAYIKALCREIINVSNFATNKLVDTIYIGGGTPSCLYNGGIKELLDCIKSAFCIEKNTEITIECNPKSVTDTKILEWVDSGVNRVSIGLQVANDCILQTIGRNQTLDSYSVAINKLKSVFDNLSVDIMYGLPGQTLEHIKSTLYVAIDHAKHISTYSLELGKNTKLYSDIINEKYILPSDDLVADMYEYVVDTLRNNQYMRYEVSNFALDGYESRHNYKYWNNIDYYGVGVSAHSKIQNIRYSNTTSVNKYIATEEFAQNRQYEIIDNKIMLYEFFMLGFRQSKGINTRQYEMLFGESFYNKYQIVLNVLIDSNILVKNGDYICISNDRFFILNDIICRFL